MHTQTTSQHTIESEAGHYVRKVWLLEPKAGPEHIAIFLDGEFYVERMDAPDLIHDLQQKGTIPATACLFVSHVDGNHRHRELTCSREFADFIAGDLAAWMSHRFPGVQRREWLIAGTSLGGLQAAFIALTHPQLFSRCLSQSGSFWWQDEWLTNHLNELPESTSRCWLSVGDQETAFGLSHPPTGLRQEVGQITACERFAKALQERRHSVHYRVFQGRHGFEPWKAELPDALHWLLA